MSIAIIGIGSNIQPDHYIPRALDRLATLGTIVSQSEFIETDPIGYTNQAQFVNGAVKLDVAIPQAQLAQALKTIETQLDRVRTANKNGPRTIDLDILMWDDMIVDRDVVERDFYPPLIAQL